VLLRGGRIAVNPGVPPAFIARAGGRPFHSVSIAPVVLAGTAGVVGAVILRDNFRDRERTRVSIRESSRFIQPNDHFVPLKPLQKGERGQLGGSAPLAARGTGIETKSKNFGGTPGTQFQNQGVQKQITPSVGQKNIVPGGNQIQNQGIQQNEQKTFQQQGGSQKTFQPKDNSQNNQFHGQDFQQQNTQQKTFQQQNIQQKTLPTQNFQQKTIQQGGQSNQQHIQQNVQPRVQPQVVQPKPVQPQVQSKDKTKTPQ
jgi:hypothetical protein